MLQVAGLALADRFYACQCLQPLRHRRPPIFLSSAPATSSSVWLLSSIRRELPPNLMLKYVNKTMQMSGSARGGRCSLRLRVLRQLALSMRIPSSSLMCANSQVRRSQAKHLTIINKRVVCDFRRQLRVELELDN